MKMWGLILGVIFAANTFASELFEAPTCNVEIAVGHLEKSLGSGAYHPLETVMPWPDVFGSWINKDRGVHIRIQHLKGVNDEPYVRVEIRSICQEKLIASGIHWITKADFQKPFLVIDAKNFLNDNGNFTLKIFPPKKHQEIKNISLEIYQGRDMRDTFPALPVVPPSPRDADQTGTK